MKIENTFRSIPVRAITTTSQYTLDLRCRSPESRYHLSNRYNRVSHTVPSMHCRQLLSLKNHSIYDSVTYPGLLGPEGLKFPGLMRLAVSGFMSSGLCGPTEDMDMLLLSRLSPGTDKYDICIRKEEKV